jgi:hypothetical protein
MLHEKSSKMARPQTHAFRQRRRIATVQSAFGDQTQGAGHHGRRADPRWSPWGSGGAASLARAKSGALGRSRRGEPHDVVRSSEWHRANGAAINSRRYGAREKASIEARVTAMYGLPTNVGLGAVTVSVILPCQNAHTSILALVNAAWNFSDDFAPDEIASFYGIVGLTGNTTATLPLTTSLSGVTVTITDSSGVARPALLYGAYASLFRATARSQP